jgi:hypothetical protein
VEADRSAYDFGDPIIVTVGNDLAHPIYATSGQTYCSIVTLEKRTGEGWQRVGRCVAGAPPGFVQIAAGDRVQVELSPLPFADEPIAPGRYHVRFTYSFERGAGPYTATYSDELTVGER